VNYLIDTNIAINSRKPGHSNLFSKFREHAGQLFLSSISWLEMERGIAIDSMQASWRRQQSNALADIFQIVPFDRSCAEQYGRLIAELGWVKGRDFDRMIAAHAIVAKAILVTNNAKDFRDIRGLQLEEWH
jgi:tRNA(fMet)-specific endonuclease VapC